MEMLEFWDDQILVGHNLCSRQQTCISVWSSLLKFTNTKESINVPFEILIFRYKGNKNLVLEGKGKNIRLIIGASVGAIVLFIILASTFLYIVVWRKVQTNNSDETQVVQPPIHAQSSSAYQDPNGILLNCPEENVIHFLGIKCLVCVSALCLQ